MAFKHVSFCNKLLNFAGRRHISTSDVRNENYSCKMLVVGGGTAGCAMAAKMCRDHEKDEVVVIEPSEDHYYQPLFTLIGGGIKNLSESKGYTADILPTKAKWIKDSAVEIDPKNNRVMTKNGDMVTYDVMVVATGLELYYDKIPGLVEALETPQSGVCSNYSHKYVEKTFETIKNFEVGNAIFTYPHSQIKCAGAPQKACYITEEFFRKQNKRHKANIIYSTPMPVIFGCKHYADVLQNICEERNIDVRYRTTLMEVDPKSKEAYFANIANPGTRTKLKYTMLHVTPPMCTHEVLRNNSDLTNKAGFVEVDKNTLQHVRFPNIFSIGDCCSAPTSKTAAAAMCQIPVAYKNIKSLIKGKRLKESYNGYTSCPLITGYGKCIMAEFDYNLEPLETLPIDQNRELLISYLIKAEIIPIMYWNIMLNGYWDGPGLLRKILHFNFKEKVAIVDSQ